MLQSFHWSHYEMLHENDTVVINLVYSKPLMKTLFWYHVKGNSVLTYYNYKTAIQAAAPNQL